jgi:hypothetical protein
VGGNVEWTTTVDIGGLPGDGWGVDVDANGNIYAAGEQGEPNESANVWFGRFSPDGDEAWSQTYAGPAGTLDSANAIAVGDDGYLVVAGLISINGNSKAIWVAKISVDG